MLTAAALAAVVFCLPAGLAAGDAARRKPNIIVILTDDQGYSDVGCYGARGFSTPNLDRMAKEGVRFTDFYAAPTCSPARASLLTGCYYQRLGIGVPLNEPHIGLNPDEVTMAESLRTIGYTTACIGKWHLGLPDEFSPIAQGFDYFSGIPFSHIRRGPTEHTDGPNAYYKRQWKKMTADGKSEIEYDPDDTLFTRRCTQEALSFIQKNRNKPFFLYLAHPQVHKEVLASKDFQGRTKRGRYGDACEELDWSVGEILKTLKRLGLDENTLVVYASDNGPWLGQGDQSGTARPLRGGKFSTFEGGMRVPCIMRWPGRIPPGTVCREVASVMDLLPTIAGFVGAPLPKDRILDGKNIWPLVSGTPGARSPHEAYFYYNKGNLEGVRSGRWKLHRPGWGKPVWRLYDLQSDIGERTNVAGRQPKIVARLKAYLEQARVDLGDERTNRIGKNVRPPAFSPPVLTPVPVTVFGVATPSASICGTWRFSPAPPEGFERAGFDDGRWAPIEVPGEWVMQGFTVAADTAAGYRRRFAVAADWAGKRIKLRFDAVYSNAVVWINGHKAGRHDGGFTAWELDVTDLVQPGKQNVIALAVKNESIADVLSSGTQYAAHQLGGITRKVTLFAVPKVNLRSLHATTTFDRQYRDAMLRVLLRIANQGKRDAEDIALRVALSGPDGAPVAIEPPRFKLARLKAGQTVAHTITIPVSAPAKWDCEHPNLYTLRSRLVVGTRPVETVTRRFGFREVEIRGNEVFVNNRPVKLRGVCRHEVHPLRGRSLTPELWRKDAELFRDANVNYIRTSHYPPAEEFIEACDELGMFVEEEAPLCWIGHPANSTSDAWNFQLPKYLSAIIRPTLEMIERDRSHPSVIIWSLANESAWRSHFVTSRRHAEAADPTRPLSFHDQCWGEANNFGSDAPIAVFHYPGAKGLARAAQAARPTLFGEYGHVNTYNREEVVTDPGIRDFWGKSFAAMWEKMFTNKGTLGGAIWSGIDEVFHLPSGKSVGYGDWGLIDGWRRPKPEYWHVKKTYSPVKILDRNLAAPAQGEPLRLKVANRHDFTNLSELRIEWAVGDDSGVTTADVPPHESGTIEIHPKAPHLDGKHLSLRIVSPRGFVIDEYRLPIGTVEKAKARPRAATDMLKLAEDDKTITVQGDGWRWVFDHRSGMIRRAEIGGRTVLLGGPTLMLLPLKGGRTVQMPSGEIAPLTRTCAQWRATDVRAARDKDGVVVHVVGKYKEAKGSYTMRVNAAGPLTIGYRFTCLRKIKPRQTGIVFDLPKTFDTLTWRRNAQWSVYPEDHVGRPIGEAHAFGPAATTVRRGWHVPERSEGRDSSGNHALRCSGRATKPSWSWAMDFNALGTNDFRATRENIVSASLRNSDGYALKVLSDGSQSTRAYVEGNRIRLLVAGFNTGGGGWYGELLAPPRKTLRPGSVVEDTVRVVLLGPTE